MAHDGITDEAAVNILRQIFVNLFRILEHPKQLFPYISKRDGLSKEREYFQNLIVWAENPQNDWINHYEAIFNHDSQTLRSEIIRRAKKNL